MNNFFILIVLTVNTLLASAHDYKSGSMYMYKEDFASATSVGFLKGYCMGQNPLLKKCFKMTEEQCRTSVKADFGVCMNEQAADLPTIIRYNKEDEMGDIGEKLGRCIFKRFVQANKSLHNPQACPKIYN